LLSRRGRRLPANASGFDTHRDSISSRFDCSQMFGVRAALPPFRSRKRTILMDLGTFTHGVRHHRCCCLSSGEY
jgi:hypothetical protein